LNEINIKIVQKYIVMINIFFLVIYLTCVSSLSNLNSINKALKYKNYLPLKPIGNLLTDIEGHQVDSIYLSNDLQYVYSEKHHETSANADENSFDSAEILNDFSVTSSNPVLANQIIDISNKNKVNSVILMKEVNPVNAYASDVLSFVGNSFDAVIYLSLFAFFVRSVFGFFQANSRGGPGAPSNFGMPPFMPGMGSGLNKDKINMQKSNVTLASWAGSPEIFQECAEVVSYLKNSTLYKRAGAEIPRGILLEGPPGTGKTLIAKAIASEADANFISVSASEFVELFVGMGAAKVRNLFKQARDNTPCIIFIDEIDAVGKQRGTGINMGNDEREQTLNQILAEMDGFAQNDGVLVIAATNRKDVLDAALLRPGRFDRLINVPLPDTSSRKAILRVHTGNKNISEGLNLDFLAEMTAGFSGAQLKNLVNEGAINAAREAREIVEQRDIENALEKIIVGIAKKVDSRSSEALFRVAVHEIGHAFLAAFFKDYFELKKVTIQSTYNGAGGYTLFSEYPEITESGLYTKDLLKKRLIVALGGKAAEHVFYGEDFVSVGATQDLKQANSIAQRMIGNYGMGDELNVFYNENTESDRNPFLGRTLGMGDKYSDKTKQKFDAEALLLVNEAYSKAISIIKDNKSKINILVRMLLDNVTLDGKFINFYVNNKKEEEE
jgi:cell division protease FtsH